MLTRICIALNIKYNIVKKHHTTNMDGRTTFYVNLKIIKIAFCC